jgi:hypothetical protein
MCRCVTRAFFDKLTLGEKEFGTFSFRNVTKVINLDSYYNEGMPRPFSCIINSILKQNAKKLVGQNLSKKNEIRSVVSFYFIFLNYNFEGEPFSFLDPHSIIPILCLKFILR